MEQIVITKKSAVEAYNLADEQQKKVIAALVGGYEIVKPEKVTDRVKSFEDACRELGIDKEDVIKGGHTIDELGYIKLKVIAKALNEGWTPDWNDDNQRKFYPWFNISGSALSFDGGGCFCSYSYVGSRLCFKSRELTEYAATQFIDIYTDFFIIK